jgi:uncharacterized protein HemX
MTPNFTHCVRHSKILVLLLLSLASSPALFAQESQLSATQLEELQSLIEDTLSNEQQQMQRLNNLNSLLAENERLLAEREELLKTLKTQLEDLSETYRKQSTLSKKYARSSKFWRTFTLAGIPAVAAISAGVTAAVLAGR